MASITVASPALRASFHSHGWPLLEMNSPTPLSSSNHPADPEFPELDEAESPKREGLPSNFRMRASAHYVDQLESPPRPTLRALAIAVIETDSLADAPEPLVTSIRTHGVLEPLLVQADARGRQYRLIAGRRRLAAARAVGLREVPCVVHTITDAEAAAWREATHAPTRDAARRETSLAPAPADATAWLYPAQRELETALTTIESCTPLLNLAPETARRAARQVIAAECGRARRILKAMEAVGVGVPLRRACLRPADLFNRLESVFRNEQRLLGCEPAIHITVDTQLTFYGDDDLLLTAMAGALSALTAAAGPRSRDLVLSAVNSGHGTIALELADRSLVLPDTFIRSAFTSAWPVPDADAVMLLLQASRRIAMAHGGSLALTGDATRTVVRFQLPAEPPVRSTAN